MKKMMNKAFDYIKKQLGYVIVKKEDVGDKEVIGKHMDKFFAHAFEESIKTKRCPPDQVQSKACICMKCPNLGTCPLELDRSERLNCSVTYITACGNFNKLTGGSNGTKEEEGRGNRGCQFGECSNSIEGILEIS